ncbi:MAG TPA: cupin domain-containing protein [Thermoflexia bacterium]|nr:cupin domain-containing protein [Thermoflexia bacterium]
MGVIHRFIGNETALDWEGVPEKIVDAAGASGVTGKVLVGPKDDAPNFRIRYFRIAPGGHSTLERHPHEHGVCILHGKARIRLGTDVVEAGPLDVVYVPGNELHQFQALGEEPLGFLCVIPAKK